LTGGDSEVNFWRPLEWGSPLHDSERIEIVEKEQKISSFRRFQMLDSHRVPMGTPLQSIL
jgi:hypothetical protein